MREVVLFEYGKKKEKFLVIGEVVSRMAVPLQARVVPPSLVFVCLARLWVAYGRA